MLAWVFLLVCGKFVVLVREISHPLGRCCVVHGWNSPCQGYPAVWYQCRCWARVRINNDSNLCDEIHCNLIYNYLFVNHVNYTQYCFQNTNW